MQDRRARAGEPLLFSERVDTRKQAVSGVRSCQEGETARHLEVSQNIQSERRRGQQVVLVVGDLLPMFVSMDHSPREVGPLRAVPGCTLPVPMMP